MLPKSLNNSGFQHNQFYNKIHRPFPVVIKWTLLAFSFLLATVFFQSHILIFKCGQRSKASRKDVFLDDLIANMTVPELGNLAQALSTPDLTSCSNAGTYDVCRLHSRY